MIESDGILCLFILLLIYNSHTHTHTHTHLTAPFLGLPGWASTTKVKPIWILLKQETLSGCGISWAICKSAPSSWQVTTPAPHHSVFHRPDALLAAQPIVSKHSRCIACYWLCPHSMRSRVCATDYPSVHPGGAALTQSGCWHLGCGSMGLQHGTQQHMWTAPCLLPRDVAEYRCVVIDSSCCCSYGGAGCWWQATKSPGSRCWSWHCSGSSLLLCNSHLLIVICWTSLLVITFLALFIYWCLSPFFTDTLRLCVWNY